MGSDRPLEVGDGLRLGAGQRRRRRSAAAQPGSSGLQRASRSFADLGLGQAAAHEPGQTGGAVTPGQGGGRESTRASSDQLGQRLRLTGAEGSARRSLAGRERRGGDLALGQGPHPALESRTGRGAQQRPVQGEVARRRQAAQATQQAGPSLGGGQVSGGSWPGLQLVQEVAIHAVRGGDRGHAAAVALLGHHERCPLRHELQPLQESGRQHRPHDQRRRGEVVVRDPARQVERQRREQRTVSADAIRDRLGRDPGRGLGRTKDHPERLPPTELDEDGLAILEVGQVRWDRVGVRTRAAGASRVDRDLDESPVLPAEQRGGTIRRARDPLPRLRLEAQRHRALPRPGRAGLRAAGARPR